MSDTGTAMIGISVARVAEEDKDDDADKNEGLKQRLDDLVDRVRHEDGRVVGDPVVDIVREARLEFSQFGADALGDIDRIRSGA